MMTKSPRHIAALELASKGIPVFPCIVGGKYPATEHGFKDATTNISIIDKWWADADYNVAFEPERAGLCVIDIDPEKGGEDSWNRLEIEHGDAPTQEVLTPSGGKHLYYRGSLPSSVSRLATGVDTRGRGGYVLCPPSEVNGRPYRYRTVLPPAEVPAWLETAFTVHEARHANADLELDHPASVDKARDRIARAVASGDVAIEGQGGNDRTYRMLADLFDLGLSFNTALELLKPWNEACSPPWQGDELEVIAASAQRNRQNDIGCKTDTESGEDKFGEAARELGAPKVRFKLHKVSDIRKRPPREWLIPDMLHERDIGIIYGPWGTYKTFMAIALAMPVARTRKVVYIAGEDEDGVANRIAAWCYTHDLGEDEHELRIIEDMPHAGSPDDILGLIDDLKAQDWRPDLIVIDTTARCLFGLDENSNRDMGFLRGALDTLRKKLRCTVVAIHHTGKDGKLRGGSSFPSDVDVIVRVEGHEESRATALHLEKIKNVIRRTEPWCYEGKEVAGSLVFHEINHKAWKTLTGQDETLEPRAVGAALVALEATGDHGVTTHVLATHIAGPDATPENVSMIERRLSLMAKGHLRAYCLGVGQGIRWSLPS